MILERNMEQFGFIFLMEERDWGRERKQKLVIVGCKVNSNI